ncbi:hypothetical protein B0H19DRAFT_1064012 [Mycena capillaripes]|nr:hypothetical protein B0H19DRAFT_1064012 [Mycena capillaripes]
MADDQVSEMDEQAKRVCTVVWIAPESLESNSALMSEAKASDIWTFNLRSATKTNDDSDSEDSNDDEPTNAISEETRLLRELDISHREETVVYKPNPFSIAKINAASRRNVAPAAVVDRPPAKPASKKPTGRIVDSFKKAEKKSNPATQSKAKEKPPSAKTIPAPPKGPSVISSHTTVSALDSISRIDDPGVPSIPIKPMHLVVSSSSDTDARDVLPQPANEIHTHISTTFPRPSPKKIMSKKFRPRLPTSFSSPLKGPSLELRGNTISNSTPRNSVAFSSPLRPTQFASVLNASRSAIVHETRVTPARKFQPHQMPTPSSSTSRPEARRTADSATGFAHAHYRALDSRSIDGPAEASSNQSSAMTVSPYPHSQPRDVCRQYDLNLPPSSPTRSPSPIRSPIPTPSPSPPRKREVARNLTPPQKSNRALKRESNDAYDYIRPDPDDEWSTLPARKKFKPAEQGRPKISGIKTTSAFRLPGTLTKGKVTGMSATSERRVVTFLPPPLKAGKVEVLVETAAPRSEEESLGFDVSGASPRAPKHSRAFQESSSSEGTPKRRRLAENHYPSPANSRLIPGEATVTAADELSVAHSSIPSSPSPVRPSAHRFPSPPTSDPVQAHDSEIHATVTVDAVSERYPRTKCSMRQLRNRVHG